MQLLPQWMARGHRASAVPLAVFRILFGLCLVFDITALLDYSPMWFDPMPYVDRAPGWVSGLLWVWLLAAVGLTLGAFSRACAVVNYAACVTFMGFISMPASCEFHPDTLYLSTSVVLPFLPIGRVWSVDSWRKPLGLRSISPGAEIFFALLVSNIYLESALWKLSSTMWMNGLGYWTPATQPWPDQVSFAWTLDNEWIAKAAGYVTLVFELAFVVLVWVRPLRWLLLAIGFTLHIGIGTVMPLPLFGLIMSALLAALMPLRAPAEELDATEPPGAGRRLAPYYLGLWAVVFAIGIVDPVRTLARVGFGGAHGRQHQTWYSPNETPVQHAAGAGLFWAYRLFGFRTHHIFLDDQFTRYTTQTRLRYHPGSTDDGLAQAWASDSEGEAFFPPAYNRRFKAWHYRTAYAFLPLPRVEDRLTRWLSFHDGRGDIDLTKGWVAIEQRPIQMPIEGWVAGQRQRNSSAAWRRVGVAHGERGAIEFEWREPCWPSAK